MTNIITTTIHLFWNVILHSRIWSQLAEWWNHKTEHDNIHLLKLVRKNTPGSMQQVTENTLHCQRHQTTISN